jgi:hypothetical protein
MNRDTKRKIAEDGGEAIDRLINSALGGLVVLKTPYGYYFLRIKKEITKNDQRFVKHAS